MNCVGFTSRNAVGVQPSWNPPVVDIAEKAPTADAATAAVLAAVAKTMAPSVNRLSTAARGVVGAGRVVRQEFGSRARILLAVVFMLLEAPGLALIALIPIPILVISTIRFGGKIRPMFKRIQEQMGVLIQQVVGREVGEMLFPVFAGVAFSRCEMRWSPRIRHTDGMAHLVLGLGTRAVDRTVDDYPVLVALEQPTLRAVQQPDEVYRYSQHDVDVVDLRENQFESMSLVDFMTRVGRKLPLMNRIFSLYRDRQILPMVGLMAQIEPDELVVTFDGTLRSSFPRELKTMLDLLEEGLGEGVDVEFAHDGDMLYMPPVFLYKKFTLLCNRFLENMNFFRLVSEAGTSRSVGE